MLFLADEPTGTLDPQTAELIHKALIEGVKDKHTTMVITSHWPEVMRQISDYVVWLENGEVMEEGNPEKVVQSFLDQVPLPEKKEEFETGGPIIQMEGVKTLLLH